MCALIRQHDYGGAKVRPDGVLTGEAGDGAAVRETEMPAVIADCASSLQPLGNPKNFEIQQRGLRGGFSRRRYRIVFEWKTLTLLTRADNDGKLEQYQIFE